MTSRKAALVPQAVLSRRGRRPLYSIRYHKTVQQNYCIMARRVRDSQDSPLRAVRLHHGRCLGKEKPEVHRSLRTQHKSAKQNMMRQRDTDIAQFYDIDATIGRGR